MENKKSILLIDDDPLVLRSLSKLLEKAGYVVHAFQDSRDAIREASMEEFDLVVTDIRMPHVDGIQAIRYIREIRTEQGNPAAPEIVIRGYAKEHQEELGGLKPAGFLYKPFPPKEFLEIISQALSRT